MSAPTTIVVPSGRESAATKAIRLRAEGRVRLRHVDVGTCHAIVLGDSGVYDVHAERSTWSCTCACFGARCSHIATVRSLVDLSTHHNNQEAQR